MDPPTPLESELARPVGEALGTADKPVEDRCGVGTPVESALQPPNRTAAAATAVRTRIMRTSGRGRTIKGAEPPVARQRGSEILAILVPALSVYQPRTLAIIAVT